MTRPATFSRSRQVFLGVFAVCMAADGAIARHLLPNSDSVQSYREMLAIRSGNLPLHGWTLATDNYILTDLVPMLAASLVLGRGPHLIYVVPFVVYASMLAAAIGIVRFVTPTHAGRLAGSYAVLLLLGIPYGLYYNFFFWSDFHVATVTCSLLAILAAAPALSGRRLARGRLAAFAGLVLAAAASDPLADALLAAPLVLVVLLRAWSTGVFRADEGLLAAAAAASAACGSIALDLLAQTGWSFAIRPSASLDFVANAHAAAHDLYAIGGAEQVLFTARARLIATLPAHQTIAAVRAITAVAVAAACLSVLWRLPRSPRAGVAEVLVAGALSVTVLAVFAGTFAAAIAPGPDFPGAATRFGVPVFVFLCIAAAVELGERATRWRPRPLAAAALCLALPYAGGAVVATVRAVRAPPGIHAGPDAELAAWLRRHHYTYGIGDYWDTQLVEALTGGVVRADPVVNVGGPLQLWPWLTDTTRFGPRNRPQFAIIRPYGLFRVDLASITRSYGKPASVTVVANQFYVARLSAGPDAAGAP